MHNGSRESVSVDGFDAAEARGAFPEHDTADDVVSTGREARNQAQREAGPGSRGARAGRGDEGPSPCNL